MAHLNLRSLKDRDHLVQLQTLASEKGFDMLAISESWLNSTVSNAEVGPHTDQSHVTLLLATSVENRFSVFRFIQSETLSNVMSN